MLHTRPIDLICTFTSVLMVESEKLCKLAQSLAWGNYAGIILSIIGMSEHQEIMPA